MINVVHVKKMLPPLISLVVGLLGILSTESQRLLSPTTFALRLVS
jgi:xanthosine utilization system XapX-like protein